MTYNSRTDKLIQMACRARNPITIALTEIFRSPALFQAFYRRGSVPDKLSGTVTLSFDCDHVEDVLALPQLIEMLASCDIRASFACIGRFIERFPAEHARITESGHEVINHTYSHPFHSELSPSRRFDNLSAVELEREIVKCDQICRTVLDCSPTGFRTPHLGVQSRHTIYDVLQRLGYRYSSSVLAIRTPFFGAPYRVENIVEFPLTGCVTHPYQAFDTYHAFRSKFTSHTRTDFVKCLAKILMFGKENSNWINLYFDPQDCLESRFFSSVLETFELAREIRTYDEMVGLLDGERSNEQA